MWFAGALADIVESQAHATLALRPAACVAAWGFAACTLLYGVTAFVFAAAIAAGIAVACPRMKSRFPSLPGQHALLREVPMQGFSTQESRHASHQALNMEKSPMSSEPAS